MNHGSYVQFNENVRIIFSGFCTLRGSLTTSANANSMFPLSNLIVTGRFAAAITLGSSESVRSDTSSSFIAKTISLFQKDCFQQILMRKNKPYPNLM